MNIKNNELSEDPEYGVDSRYKSKKERESDAVKLMQARLERMKKLPKKEIVRARLFQLKLRMENYLREPGIHNHTSFSEFLKKYIDTIYSKRSKFADDIGITPVLLSQIINNHRDPQAMVIKKLMIHSEKAFNNVCPFDSKIWYQVYFHDRMCETISNQKKWRPEIEKQVKFSESIE